MSTRVKHWRTVYFNSQRALIVGLLIVAFFFIINFHVIFTFPFETAANKTNLGTCVSKQVVAWRQYHTYTYSIIPFMALFIINSLLIHEIIRLKKNVNEKKKTIKSNSISISVIAFTVVYIVFTGPYAVTGGYFLSTLLQSEPGQVILFSSIALDHSFHGTKFFILLLTNKKFKLEVYRMLQKERAGHCNTTYF